MLIKVKNRIKIHKFSDVFIVIMDCSFNKSYFSQLKLISFKCCFKRFN